MPTGSDSTRGSGASLRRKKDPAIETKLKALVDEHTGGDPLGKRKYARCSLRWLARQLKTVSHTTVGRLLRKLGYSLRANVKRLSGPPHPDRDRQFRYLRRKKRAFLKAGLPVVSVDTKNTELIGNFRNKGTLWRREADEVSAYDFPGDAECRAIPYGIYDVAENRGHVSVGTSADTSQFAVRSIRDWWKRAEPQRYAGATDLLITADSGGSNGCRPRLWKRELQRWADEDDLTITVCHYPRGASKWNDIEHRLFGPITHNWAGQPLRSLDLMLNAIRGTTTNRGLRVTARLDPRKYPKKIKVPDREMRELNLHRHTTCPDWNYTIRPRPSIRK